MSAAYENPARGSSGAGILLGLTRPHILSIVFASTLTYGWIFSGRHEFLIPCLAVWDWFIVNFNNKATDVAEDLANGIPGAEQIAQHKRAAEALSFAMIAAGLAAGLVLVPEILPFRILFTAIGLGYNYHIVPSIIRDDSGRLSAGFSRFKEMYFFKNFGSSMLFTLSVFVYPLFGLGVQDSYPLSKVLLAIAFFIPLELTYEIIYDLRDVDGDRTEGVPTYPVVHGERRAKQIIIALLCLSAVAPIVGGLTGWLRLREWVVVAGVVQQFVIFWIFCRGDRRPNQRQTEVITTLGTAQLLAYNVWVWIGLPLGT